MSTESTELEDFGGIFNISAEEAQAASVGSSFEIDPDYYRPSERHKKAKGGVYESLIRFAPNPKDRLIQCIEKYVYCLPDIKLGKADAKFYVDCPSGWGSQNNILTTAFFIVKESESMAIRNLKEHFTRKQYWWRLVQIINDEQEPDLNFKIRIMRYGKQLKEKMDIQLSENPKEGKVSCNFIDPFDGKNFKLKVDTVKTDRNGVEGKMTSYEKSFFQDDRSIMMLSEGVHATKDKVGMQSVFEYLKASAPDLSKAAVKKWDDATEQKVIETVKLILEDDQLFARIYKKAYGKEYFGTTATTATEKKVEDKATTIVAEKVEVATEKKSPAIQTLADKVATKETAPVVAETKVVETKVEEAKPTNIADVEINFEEID